MVILCHSMPFCAILCSCYSRLLQFIEFDSDSTPDGVSEFGASCKPLPHTCSAWRDLEGRDRSTWSWEKELEKIRKKDKMKKMKKMKKGKGWKRGKCSFFSSCPKSKVPQCSGTHCVPQDDCTKQGLPSARCVQVLLFQKPCWKAQDADAASSL